jgi:hypothetical protein
MIMERFESCLISEKTKFFCHFVIVEILAKTNLSEYPAFFRAFKIRKSMLLCNEGIRHIAV